jgi:hypothetical protein
MLPPFLYLDRYRNDGTRVYSPHAAHTEADPRFRPDISRSTFPLPVFSLPTGELNIYRSLPHPDLQGLFVGENETLFVVHPQVLESGREDPYLLRTLRLGRRLEPLSVAPGSSTRTLFVQGLEPPHALKVHFPFRVSRYSRRMRDEVVEQAVGVSRELEEGSSSMSVDFAFQREVLGVAHRRLEPDSPRGENWGYLVRDLRAFPPKEPGSWLVPGFSLYGRDRYHPDAPPLFFDLPGSVDPLPFTLEKVMFPIIRHWVEAYRNFGFFLEPHGQNVLLEIRRDGEPVRIVHRDLSVGVDQRRRRELGLATEGGNTYNRMQSGEFGSITYDKFMGAHFFEYLVQAILIRHPDLGLQDFQQPCREWFGTLFPDHEKYLPRTVQYFSEVRDSFGKPVFEDTGALPGWRP